MLTNINWWLVLAVSVLQIIFGSIWYGPIFGKFWMKLMGVTHMSKEDIKKAQKEMMPMYAIQLLMSFIMNIALYTAVKINSDGMLLADICATIALWIGFVVPIQVGEVIWSNLSNEMKMKKLAVSSVQQLITMCIAAAIFSYWG